MSEERGNADRRPVRRSSTRRRTDPTPTRTARREKLTPPCAGVHPHDGQPCRYPLLNTDDACPRCGTPRPGADAPTEAQGVKRETRLEP